jgi:hypothetical protein
VKKTKNNFSRRGALDRIAMLERLAEAERRVAEDEANIRRQTEVIALLQRGGISTEASKDLLSSFQAAHAAHVAERDRLRSEIGGLD